MEFLSPCFLDLVMRALNSSLVETLVLLYFVRKPFFIVERRRGILEAGVPGVQSINWSLPKSS